MTYWADELAEAASGGQVVNDSKTPSGTVHVGSLRGVVLHDAIWRALRARGSDARFLYGVDDLDAMDAASLLTKDAVERYMGVPLARVPPPEGSSAPSYARHFVGELFLPTFAGLGISPEFYWMSELYETGAMDPYIRRALDRADRVREIYRRVSAVEKPEGWLPIQVICQNCGRVGTTIARDWDGEVVRYECRPDLVEWARGCGHRGEVSPFGGRSTLPWNLEWAAKWSHFGVTIEGCGKDLATAGGSRDRSDAISREVFEREPPRNVPYEFLNVGGRKMSTSQGRGAAAHEIARVLPPEILRFLFLRQRPNRAIEFDPAGETIPALFDEFDRIADAVAGRSVRGSLPPDADRIFWASLVDPTSDPVTEASRFRPPFRQLALLLQIPGVDLGRRMLAEKGGVLDAVEQRILDERVRAARAWLSDLAPDRYRIEVRRDALPAEAADLTEEQRDYLAALAGAAATGDPQTGDGWQELIYTVAHARGLPSADAFSAVYLAFLGRANGPRAGWLLASLPLEFVLSRLRDAALMPPPVATAGLA